jgi:hypothetical protein
MKFKIETELLILVWDAEKIERFDPICKLPRSESAELMLTISRTDISPLRRANERMESDEPREAKPNELSCSPNRVRPSTLKFAATSAE